MESNKVAKGQIAKEEFATKKFLVTGITGFLGSTLAKLLLESNYQVRGTVRSKSNQRKMLPLKSLSNLKNLEVVEADLLLHDSWSKAVQGCNYVFHVASPFPSSYPKDESEVIEPAVSGTLSVLRAAYKHNIEHVVLTSSVAAVQSVGKSAKPHYSENDWTDLRNATPYYKSKAMAERAAWEYYRSLPRDRRFRLTTILPGLMFGPAMVTTDFTSGEIVRQLLTGMLFAVPKINYPVVDVRDVALAHLRAVELPEKTDGERFICCSESHLWFIDIANILKRNFAKYGYKVTTRKARYFQVRLVSLFHSKAHTLLPFWGLFQTYSNAKIKRVLGITFRNSEQAILSMVHSMIEKNIVPDLTRRTKL